MNPLIGVQNQSGTIIESQVQEFVSSFIYGGSEIPLIREFVVTFIYEN